MSSCRCPSSACRTEELHTEGKSPETTAFKHWLCCQLVVGPHFLGFNFRVSAERSYLPRVIVRIKQDNVPHTLRTNFGTQLLLFKCYLLLVFELESPDCGSYHVLRSNCTADIPGNILFCIYICVRAPPQSQDTFPVSEGSLSPTCLSKFSRTSL